MKIDDWMRMVSIGFVRLSPPAVFSLPTCDDIMVLNATRGNFLRSKAAAKMVSTRRSCAIRCYGKTTKHALESVGDKTFGRAFAVAHVAIAGAFFAYYSSHHR